MTSSISAAIVFAALFILIIISSLNLAFVDALTDAARVNAADPSVQLEILLTHAYYRKSAKPKPAKALPALKWNAKAAKTAATVASQIAQTCSLQHSATSQRTIDGVACGENLAWRSSSSPDPYPWDLAIGLWGDERLHPSWKFGCAQDAKFSDWGHYTQIVSQRSTTVGCAAQKCAKNPSALVFVCHYCAAGNFAPLGKPYTVAAAEKADCNAPNPKFPKKPTRTKPPTAQELVVSTTTTVDETVVEQPAAAKPPPPLQEPDGGNSIDTAQTDTQQLVVFKHNLYRRTAIPQPAALDDLVWNPDAAATARRVAARLAQYCTLSHSSNTERVVNNQQCGENLGFLSGTALTARPWDRIVALWGDERDSAAWQYGCSADSTFSDWGHYTQLVAQRTTSVGCAAIKCGNSASAVIFVCHYCAAGNYPPYNQPYKPAKQARLPACKTPASNDMIFNDASSSSSSVPLNNTPILADATASSSIDTGAADVRTLVLDSHNRYRHEVCPRPVTPLSDLTWDFAASSTAETVAYRLANSGGCSLAHSLPSERNSCGENLGFLGGSLLTTTGVPAWQKVVSLWGDERRKFAYGTSPTSSFSDYGHYTQVVWEQTKSVGCAAATCASGSLQSAVFVCHYCPAGNYPPINKPYAADPLSPLQDCASAATTASSTTTTAAAAATTSSTTPTPTTTGITNSFPAPTTPPPATPASTTLDTSDPNVQDFIINLHNIERQSASNPTPASALAALTWNDDLASASRLVLSNGALLQNFQISCSAATPNFPAIANPIQLAGRICTANAGGTIQLQQNVLPWQQAIQRWAGDKFRFVYGCSDPTRNFDDWGHYTQMVDGMTSEIGCAASACTAAAGSTLTALMFCVYCDSAKSKPDYALNKPYDSGSDNLYQPQCTSNDAMMSTIPTLEPTTSTGSTTIATQPTTMPTTLSPTTTTQMPTSLSVIDTSRTSVQNYLLAAHNAIRNAALPSPRPVLPQLTWNSQLTSAVQQNAQQIAQSYCRSPGVAFAPTSSSSASTCGINAAVVDTSSTSSSSSSSNDPWQLALDQWSAGKSQFKLGCSSSQTFNAWGQYTQILGKNTTSMSCGAAQCANNNAAVAIVCAYCAAGNVAGQLNLPYSVATPRQIRCRSSELLLPVADDNVPPSSITTIDLEKNVDGFAMPRDTVRKNTVELSATDTSASSDIGSIISAAVLEAQRRAPALKLPVEQAPTTTPETSTTVVAETVTKLITPPPTPTSVSDTTTTTSKQPSSSTSTASPPRFGSGDTNNTTIELTCPTAFIDGAISPWMALPNYNRCIVFVRGPTGRAKLQQCASPAINGTLLHADSDALKSLITLLRRKLANDANDVIYEVSSAKQLSAGGGVEEQRTVKRQHPLSSSSTMSERRLRRHAPEMVARDGGTTYQQQTAESASSSIFLTSAAALPSGGDEKSVVVLPKSSAINSKLNSSNNDFRSLLARTARDRKILDTLLGMDPSIEQRALDSEGRAVIAQDAFDTRSGRQSSTSGLPVMMQSQQQFVSPLVKRFLQLLPPDACNFIDNTGYQERNELACGIYQWTARHGYICQAPLGNSIGGRTKV